jgi:hypothetical protein
MRRILVLAWIIYYLCHVEIGVADCDSQGRPPWKDTRAKTINGSEEVVQEAWNRILRRIPLGNFGNSLKTPQYNYKNGPCDNDDNGCLITKKTEYRETSYRYERRCVPMVYRDRYTGRCCIVYVPRTEWVPHTETTYEFDHRITLTDCVFQRGWYDLDESGDILWSRYYNYQNPMDNDNLYYRYALSLVEAIEFVILHELAHVGGKSSEADADKYAREMMLEMRKEARGMFTFYRSPGIQPYFMSSSTKSFSCQSHGYPPPLDNLPPGSSR